MCLLSKFVCVCACVWRRAQYRCTAYASPNYNDNVRQCWRNIHHACLAFGIERRWAITGLSNHFTALLCVLVFLHLWGLKTGDSQCGVRQLCVDQNPGQHKWRLNVRVRLVVFRFQEMYVSLYNVPTCDENMICLSVLYDSETTTKTWITCFTMGFAA